MKKFLLTLALVFGISSQSLATVNWTKHSYFTNLGGLNDSLASTEIQDNEASDLQNVVFDTGGAVKKRYGYALIPSGTSYTITGGTNCVVTGLIVYRKNDGSRYLVAVGSVNNAVASVSEKTYQVGGGLPSGTFVSITGSGTLPTSGYTNNNLACFTVASDTLVFTLPATLGQKPFMWSGSGNVLALTSNTNVPSCSLVVYHKNQLFTNDSSYPSRVHFSDLTNGIQTWNVLDFLDVNANDGTQVRGMISAFNALYIFKDKSIWCLTGDNKDNFVLQKFVDGVGTLSQQSIGVIGNYIYFVTGQGDICIYDGVYQVAFPSSKIRNTIGGTNFQRANNILGIPFSTYKYLNYDFYVSNSTASSSQNNQVLFYDTEKKAWSKFSGINANAWCVGDNSVGQNILIFGDYGGYVYSYPSTGYADNTTAINAYYQTKWFRYPDVALGDKVWMLLNTYVLSESSGSMLTIGCGADYQMPLKTYSVSLNQAGSLWDSMVWDVSQWVGQSLMVDREEVNLGSRMFQLKYSNANLNEGFTVNGFETFIMPTDRI